MLAFAISGLPRGRRRRAVRAAAAAARRARRSRPTRACASSRWSWSAGSGRSRARCSAPCSCTACSTSCRRSTRSSPPARGSSSCCCSCPAVSGAMFGDARDGAAPHGTRGARASASRACSPTRSSRRRVADTRPISRRGRRRRVGPRGARADGGTTSHDRRRASRRRCWFTIRGFPFHVPRTPRRFFDEMSGGEALVPADRPGRARLRVQPRPDRVRHPRARHPATRSTSRTRATSRSSRSRSSAACCSRCRSRTTPTACRASRSRWSAPCSGASSGSRPVSVTRCSCS